MKKLLFNQILLLSVVLAMTPPASALDVKTHEAINIHIAQHSLNGFSFRDYLINQLGFEIGEDTEFNSLAAWKWLRDGGRYEDKPPWTIPYLRSLNHFHNPLTDQGYGIGGSAIQWSQKPKETQSPGGYYSWHDVRDYFYSALTLPVKSNRDTSFASTFRGLGQLMHLVQDMSVPEHSRNDGHVAYCYEDWVRDSPTSQAILTNALANPTFFNKDALLLASQIPGAAVPIANLFDTNQYTGSNPDITVQDNIGLAEFSNANFLSPDTMIYAGFSGDFPNPDWSNIVESNPINAAGEKTSYLKKLGMGESQGGKTGSGASVEHLAAVRWPYKYLPQDKKYGKYLSLNDDLVYKDYAALMLPRAVGYSSQLLNYFFRGQIDMIPDDATGSGYVIVNNTEEVLDGTFELCYDKADPVDERAKIILSNGSFILGTKSSGNNTSPNITFTPPTGAKEPGKYILVFRGRLGNETDAVAAKLISGAFYVAGQTSDNRWFVKKLTLNGDPVWVKYVDDGSSWSVAADDSGVYVGGKTNLAEYGNWRVEKRSLQTGEIIWSNSINSWASTVRRLRLHNGFLYAVGNDADNSGRLQKLNINDGSVVWHTTVYEDYYSVGASDCFVNDSGVYIVGGLYRDASFNDGSSYAIQKRDLATGVLLDFWSYPDYGNWILYRCAGDDSGLYVSGRQTNINNDFVWSVEKRSFDNLGTVLWRQTVSPALNAQSSDMAVDNSGVYTTGSLTWSPSRLEKRDLSSGALLWERLDSSWNPFGICTYPAGIAYTYATYTPGPNGHIATKAMDGVDGWDVANEPLISTPYAIVFYNK